MYSKNQIKKAWKILSNKKSLISDKLKARWILEFFRLEHIDWLRNFRKLLARKTEKFKNILISQRLKRTPSIVNKLKINKSMSLAQMQDIWWLRIVCNNLEDVYEIKKLVRNTEVQPNFKSNFRREDDYINTPKLSWYRGIHLVYHYDSKCFIEIQIRNKIQHAWATAVEVLWSYLKQPLKQSLWDDSWLKLFVNISKAFAFLEKWKVNIPFFSEVLSEIESSKLLDKVNWFNSASKIINDNKEIKKGKWSYFLIILDYFKKTLTIEQFNEWKIADAMKKYSVYEESYNNDKNHEVVLVSVEDIKNLKKLYPNYFLDTKQFIKYINKMKTILWKQ